MSLKFRLLSLVVLVVVLVVLVDPRQTMGLLLHADPAAIGVALLVSIVGVVLSAWKWVRVLRARGVEMPLAQAIRYYWVGMFFSNFLPTSIGGDAIRLTMAREHAPAPELAASIVVERLTGLGVLFILLAAGLALHATASGSFAVPPAIWLLVAFAAVGTILMLVLPGTLQRLSRAIRLRAPALLRPGFAFFERTLGILVDYHGNFRLMSSALLMSLPFYLTILGAHWAVLIAVGADVTAIELMVAAPLVSLASVAPITPNGAGVAEGSFVLLYASGAGVLPELALAAAILRRLVDLANSAIGGALWMVERRVGESLA